MPQGRGFVKYITTKYLRQYVGFTLAGRRLIFLNAFSASDEDFVLPSRAATRLPGA
jgi:hypothetical protein